jgi:hypothetical protein
MFQRGLKVSVSAMYKSIVGALSVALVWTGFAAGASALEFSTQSGVVDQCAKVMAEELKTTDSWNELSGSCVNGTASYLSYLTGAGLTADEFSAQIGSLIIDLTNVLVPRTCAQESELVRAIAIASTATPDEEQRKQIMRIRGSIGSCETGTSDFVASGVPASFN